MAQLTTLLLYEIQKKYPEAVGRADSTKAWDRDRVVIIYRGIAAVTLNCSFVSYTDGTIYSSAKVSFDYHGKERSRDNNVYLRDLIEPQEVTIPGDDNLQPRKVSGILINPNRISIIAKACLKKIAPLFKIAKERIDVEVRMAEQAKLRGTQLFNDVKAAVGEKVDVQRDGSAVTIGYRGFIKTLYFIGDARKVSVSVPLNKLADVLDLLAEPQAAVA